MDLSKIKQKLEELNQERQTGNDYAKYFWNPPMGKTIIRIVPSKDNPDTPFTELYFHNVIAKYPILALTNFGEQDPVEEFRRTLQNAGGKDNWSMSGKLTPRARYFAPVIVRGEEDKGVRLWSFGSRMYKALLSLAAEDEIGDYTDINDGIDLIITKAKGDGDYPESTVMAKRQNSPLSSDPKQIEEWLTNQPVPLECFRKADYNYIKKQLEAYVSGVPASTVTAPVSTEETEDKEKSKKESMQTPAPAPAVSGTVKGTKQPPKSVAAKFDDLFGDSEDDSTDDLFKED